MVTSVQTNLQSLNAQRSLGTSQSSLATAMQRLSSGLRINSAKDDAAGLAVSNRMTSQIKGLDQAVRNANDGISIAQTAEGALGEITNNLQSLRQLAMQSANGTYTTTDRASMQQQAAQIQQEITRLATQTQFNGKSLLDGSFAQVALQVGAYANQTISFDIDSVKAADIGANQAVSKDSVGPAKVLPPGTKIQSKANIGSSPIVKTDITGGNNGVASGSLTIISDFVPGGMTVNVAAGDSAKTIAENINNASVRTGVAAAAINTVDFTDFNAGNAVLLKFNLQNNPISVTGTGNEGIVTLKDIANAINNSNTGVTATIDNENNPSKITLASDGSDIKIGNFTGIIYNAIYGGISAASSIVIGGQTVTNNSTSITTTTTIDPATGTETTATNAVTSVNALDSIVISGQISLSPATSKNLSTISVVDGTGNNSVLGSPFITKTVATAEMQDNGVAAQTLTVTGDTGTANVSVPANTSAFGIAQLVNEQSSKTGVTATARTEATLSDLSAAGTVSFQFAGSNATPVTISANVTSANDLSEVAKAINNVASSTGIMAELSDDKKTVKFVSADGYDIKISDFSNNGATAGSLTAMINNTGLTQGDKDSLTVGGKVSFNASGPFTVTSTDSTIVSGTTTSHLSPVSGVDIGTQQGATDAIDVVDGAIAVVDRLRGMLGAIQNRLSSVVSSNQATTLNVTSARSQVQDTDFAAETSNLSRAQILQQADLAMIAQANQLPQQVLKLLQ